MASALSSDGVPLSGVYSARLSAVTVYHAYYYADDYVTIIIKRSVTEVLFDNNMVVNHVFIMS